MFKMSSYVSQIPFGLKNINLSINLSSNDKCIFRVAEYMNKSFLILGKNAREPDVVITEDEEIVCPGRSFRRNQDFRWNLREFAITCRKRLDVEIVNVDVLLDKKGRVGMAAWSKKVAS